MNRHPVKEHKRVVFFDYFATITFIFSILAIAAIVMCAASYFIYGFTDKTDVIKLLNDKEPIMIVTAIVLLAFIVMFVVNFIFNCIKANWARINESPKGVLVYIIGMFIPFLSLGYFLDVRKSLFFIANHFI